MSTAEVLSDTRREREGGVPVIDNPGTVARLVVQLENQLPIPAFPTKEVVRTLRRRGLQASTDRALSVKRVFYAGDEAGFVCDVTPSRTATEVLIVSRQSHNFADVCHSELLRLTQRVADILRLEDALSLETDAELKRGTILIHGRFTRTARVRSDRCAEARATTEQAFGRDFHGALRDSIDRRIAAAARRNSLLLQDAVHGGLRNAESLANFSCRHLGFAVQSCDFALLVRSQMRRVPPPALAIRQSSDNCQLVSLLISWADVYEFASLRISDQALPATSRRDPLADSRQCGWLVR